MRGLGTVAVGLLCSAGCMPWAVGQTAETAPPGRLEAGLAGTALAPPATPGGALIAPQAWARAGVLDDLDVGLTYAVPLTFQADAKLRFLSRSGYALAAQAGGGMHGTPIPERLGIGPRRAVWTPFAVAGILASARRTTPRPYASVRAFAPFVVSETFATTVWGTVTVGAEWSRGGLRLAPEVGAIVPASHPEDVLLTAAFGVRWASARR